MEIIKKCHYHFFFGGGGDHKADKCRNMVGDLIQSHKAMGYNMSLGAHLT